MSHGPTARIYYGYDLASMTIYHSDGERFEDKYEELAPGWWSDESPSEHHAKLRGLESWQDPPNGDPVEMEGYGSLNGYGETCWTVQVKASVQELYYYDSKLVQPLEVDPAWDEQLRVYAEEMGLILPSDTAPAWHFNCSYDG